MCSATSFFPALLIFCLLGFFMRNPPINIFITFYFSVDKCFFAG